MNLLTNSTIIRHIKTTFVILFLISQVSWASPIQEAIGIRLQLKEIFGGGLWAVCVEGKVTTLTYLDLKSGVFDIRSYNSQSLGENTIVALKEKKPLSRIFLDSEGFITLPTMKGGDRMLCNTNLYLHYLRKVKSSLADSTTYSAKTTPFQPEKDLYLEQKTERPYLGILMDRGDSFLVVNKFVAGSIGSELNVIKGDKIFGLRSDNTDYELSKVSNFDFDESSDLIFLKIIRGEKEIELKLFKPSYTETRLLGQRPQ